MDERIPKFVIDNSDEPDDDDFYGDPIQYLDANGNSIQNDPPRSTEELSVGSNPIDLQLLSKISNLDKIRLISKWADAKHPFEMTGKDKTGVISEESFCQELIVANTDIMLKEITTISLPTFSGETNNN